ncbi:Maleylacetoacetate isomerase [Plasmodiophora brassicae]|uniref:Maleylacetoacetate isomerase n=1 Tax=Plasmodiophora brassicae TaxID=37360 RepID=A0A0G4IVY6_PLABS|nr:hypothetical protein PBRA_001132 [Plasmodiophora brassicae]SPQ97236.1 unnamed protein product [Plasmodiophora brassicae]
MTAVRLFSYWRSSCSYRVRIALALKSIPYEYVAVNLVQGCQNDETVMDSPMHQVPVLQIDDRNLHESLAIVEYLEETRPAHPLLPTDPYLRSVARRQALMIVADIQPIQNLRVLRKQTGDAKEWATFWIENGFQALEKEVSKTAGKYCIGDNVTIADVCLIPQVYNARRFSIDMSKYPTLLRVATALEGLPAFVKAHPDNQPDAIKE